MDDAKELSRFGEIAIFNHGKGWRCKCEMFVSGQGVKVEVSSDHHMPSIESAIAQCLERCMACIKELNEKSSQAKIGHGK